MTTPSSSSSSLPLASAASALLHRLTAPLRRPRTRNIADFHIQPLEPHRQYAPGDVVQGAVVLTVVRPIRVTHLTICLHGLVRVYKSPAAAKDPFPLQDTVNGVRKSRYLGNGHACLFQDESALCGEGRLEPGLYRFNFELDFPAHGLPTSIDFERGTIAYMLTATLTRPTSIAATTTCDTKLALTETIDVGALAPPKSRTISLEPIIRHPKAKHRSLRSQEVSKDVDSSTEWVSPRVSLDTSTVPQSPAQSDAQSSAASTSSSGNRVSFRLAQAASTSTPSRPSPAASSSKASIREKTITANIELTKAGCLAGDTLLIRVNVQHSKAIKSLHGIIVTLYRQGRIDYSPPLSLFGDIDAKEAQRIKHNEYYPKSKTGLGGLSLTSAGSSSVFRKDLSQTFAPLIVDPHSLISTLTASVKVPEDAFPTISGVPGAMISFKYYVEVIVDLGGKLAGQQRHLPRLGTLPTPGSFSGRTESGAGMLAALSGSTVDTEHLRREKSVVACAFEVIVGTRDSERTRKTAPVDAATRAPSRVDPIEEHSAEQEGDSGDYPGEYDYHYYDAAAHGDELYDDHYNYDDYHEYHDAPPLMPPPNLDADVDPLDDKERIRRAEERLLPSQPPGQDAPGPSTVQNGSCTESTPLASLAQPDVQSSVDESPSIHTQLPTHPSAPTIEDLQLSSPPALSSVSASVNGTTHGDDKRELERQRLLAEASSPFDHVEVEVDHHVDSDADAEPESSTHALAREPLVPSAPHLTLEPYGYSYAHQEGATSAPRDAATLENLPQYER